MDMITEQKLRESYRRRFVAALASSTGAAATGVGFASLIPAMPVAIAILFFLTGFVIHITGMVIAHRADAEAMITPPGWHQPLTIACWIALIGLAAIAAFPLISSPR
jgi:putative Mn2+ efflux pump MntP